MLGLSSSNAANTPSVCIKFDNVQSSIGHLSAFFSALRDFRKDASLSIRLSSFPYDLDMVDSALVKNTASVLSKHLRSSIPISRECRFEFDPFASVVRLTDGHAFECGSSYLSPPAPFQQMFGSCFPFRHAVLSEGRGNGVGLRDLGRPGPLPPESVSDAGDTALSDLSVAAGLEGSFIHSTADHLQPCLVHPDLLQADTRRQHGDRSIHRRSSLYGTDCSLALK
jgi:hypothetical protein